jgi:isocitrate dehydrogenase
VATIFAWSGALRKRGELDGNEALAAFADKLEKAVLDTIEGGVMTADLAALCQGEDVRRADTEGFLRAIRMKLEA